MDTVSGRLTILFEDSFWIGVYERESDGQCEVSRIVFGAEPSNAEVAAFLAKHWKRLRFSPPVPAEARKAAGNPKRMQRAVTRALQAGGIGTKAQQALQLEREQHKRERRADRRERREAEEARRFELRQARRREKRRGH